MHDHGLATPRRRDRRGLASLEVILIAPFLFLVLALLVSLAYTHRAKARMESSTHLAVFTYSTQRAQRIAHGEAQAEAQKRVRDSFFSEATVQVATGASMGEVEGLDEDGSSAWTDALDMFLPVSESRQTATVSAEIEPPMLQDVFPARTMTTKLTTELSPWTFDEWGLMSGVMNQGAGGVTIGDVASLGLWPLGMVGKWGCFGGS